MGNHTMAHCSFNQFTKHPTLLIWLHFSSTLANYSCCINSMNRFVKTVPEQTNSLLRDFDLGLWPQGPYTCSWTVWSCTIIILKNILSQICSRTIFEGQCSRSIWQTCSWSSVCIKHGSAAYLTKKILLDY